jgi:CRISPR-associated protein Cas2
MFVLISYDIPNDKRRTKVMKLLKNFGNHVQFSVFECELKEEPYGRLREQLEALIAPKEDNVRLYFFDEDAIKKIEMLGVGEVTRAKPYYVIG